MKYQDLLNSISSILIDEKIIKEGLLLTYELNEEDHRNLNEEVFYMFNRMTEEFIPDKEFEISYSGIVVKFVKKVVEVN